MKKMTLKEMSKEGLRFFSFDDDGLPSRVYELEMVSRGEATYVPFGGDDSMIIRGPEDAEVIVVETEVIFTILGITHKPLEQYIMIGGMTLQTLSPDEMILRRCFFQSRGFPTQFAPNLRNDLIQMCRETGEIIISRDSSLYHYYILTPERFKEVWSMMMEAVFVQTWANRAPVDNSEFISKLEDNELPYRAGKH